MRATRKRQLRYACLLERGRRKPDALVARRRTSVLLVYRAYDALQLVVPGFFRLRQNLPTRENGDQIQLRHHAQSLATESASSPRIAVGRFSVTLQPPLKAIFPASTLVAHRHQWSHRRLHPFRGNDCLAFPHSIL